MNEYVGIPYKAGGRDREGCDCYGLVWMVLHEQFGKTLPKFEACVSHGFEESERMISEHLPLIPATSPDVPAAGDIVLLKILGRPCHVGIYLGGGLMLHSLAEHDSAIDRVDGPRWAKRIEGYYRV